MKYLFIIIFSLCFSEIFRGEVSDVGGNPIIDANVELINNSKGTATDDKGLFIFNDIFLKSDILKVSHIAYDDFIIEINVLENPSIKIVLENSSIDYNPIVITSTRSERHIKDVPVLTHVIGQEDIKNSSYSNVKDILEMAMPNVQMVTSNHGNDRVKIQGLDNKYLTFLVDGDRVSGEFAGNLDFSMLGLSNVDKIEVIEGAMSTLYGSGAIGGVINIITKKNKEAYWFNAGIHYDDPLVVSPSINAGFNKGILNYNLNAQYSESDGYDLTPNDLGQFNMTLDENNSKIFNHRLILMPSDKHNLLFSFKDYSSRVNKYKYFAGNLVVDAPLNRYEDDYYKIRYDYKISSNQSFKISYIKEDYVKYYYYPYYYSHPQYIFDPEEFVNGILNREEINLHYSSERLKSKRLIGLELYNEDYSSFNIYDVYGEELQESIFEGQDLTKSDSNISLYFYEERNFKESRSLSFGLRILNVTEKEIVLPSISYLIKGNNNYNYRLSYSSGYRTPSIKERYYNWPDHFGGLDILGNVHLKPTENNYFSVSLDKRSSINDFSVDIYSNEITNMISTEYGTDPIDGDYLQYKNYDEVLITGMNIHYYRKVTEKLKLKFVYNLTDASSNSDEILEGISKHALRLNLYYKLFDKLNFVTNVKYVGKKFIFDQEQDFLENPSIIELSNYSISDVYLATHFEKILFKVGVKNVFNYKDSKRLTSNILNNYDPGRRVFIELNLQLKGQSNDK